MLIDELIHVDLELASIAQLPLIHRKFACFFKLTVEDEQIVITKDSLENDLKKLDEAASEARHTNSAKETALRPNEARRVNDNKETILSPNIDEQTASTLIKTWFNSGGLELTVVNTNQDITKVSKIEPKNLIFVGHPEEMQLNELYKKLPVDIIKDKNLFFSVSEAVKLEDYPKSREVFFYLAGNPASFYSYFAPYTASKYYAKNNYKTSALEGAKLKNLDFLLSNNIGALVYFPEFKESKYLNIKDAAGFNYNLDVLKDDLVSDIKANLLTALSSNNVYNQSNILRLENVMANAIDTYVDLNLVNSYQTSSLPYSKQTEVDKKNNILRGLQAKYTVQTEIEQVYVKLKEEV